jgi:hypothetical protein
MQWEKKCICLLLCNISSQNCLQPLWKFLITVCCHQPIKWHIWDSFVWLLYKWEAMIQPLHTHLTHFPAWLTFLQKCYKFSSINRETQSYRNLSNQFMQQPIVVCSLLSTYVKIHTMLPSLCANIFCVFSMMDNLDTCLSTAQTTFCITFSSTVYRFGFQVPFQPSIHKTNVNSGLYRWHKTKVTVQKTIGSNWN